MQPNHTMPISDRTKKGTQEKKPVKPRAPRQRNPNATGRKRDPILNNKEHKKSGYARFYQQQRKDLKLQDEDFGTCSTRISQLWALLSDEQKASYAQEVNSKRREMLKNKASQQALELAQGPIKLE